MISAQQHTHTHTLMKQRMYCVVLNPNNTSLYLIFSIRNCLELHLFLQLSRLSTFTGLSVCPVMLRTYPYAYGLIALVLH